jgi:hypothetical protein
MTQSHLTRMPDPTAIAAAALRRVEREIRSLGCICRLGRRGLALARAARITAAAMSQDDTRAILVGLEVAEADGTSGDYVATARLVRSSLEVADCWYEAETREWVCGCRWGAASLATLFRGLAEYEAEEAIGPALLALTAEQGVAQ